jgi:hypothetical protein
LETSGCELFGKAVLATLGANCQGRIGHFLQEIFREAARSAFIGINWHGVFADSMERSKALDCKLLITLQ